MKIMKMLVHELSMPAIELLERNKKLPPEDCLVRVKGGKLDNPVLKTQPEGTRGCGRLEQSLANKTELTVTLVNHLYDEAAICQNASCCPLRSHAMVQSFRAV
jgi:hypothetical protein